MNSAGYKQEELVGALIGERSQMANQPSDQPFRIQRLSDKDTPRPAAAPYLLTNYLNDGIKN